MKRRFLLSLLMIVSSILCLSAEVVNTGLEFFPPFIINDQQGITLDLLKRIGKKSNLDFQVKIMPYNRAKLDLKTNRLDLIGHTPYGLETNPSFE